MPMSTIRTCTNSMMDMHIVVTDIIMTMKAMHMMLTLTSMKVIAMILTRMSMKVIAMMLTRMSMKVTIMVRASLLASNRPRQQACRWRL